MYCVKYVPNGKFVRSADSSIKLSNAPTLVDDLAAANYLARSAARAMKKGVKNFQIGLATLDVEWLFGLHAEKIKKTVQCPEKTPLERAKNDALKEAGITDLQLWKKISTIISDSLGVTDDKIYPSSTLEKDLGCDSLDEVELLMAIEDEFSFYAKDEEAENVRTVKDVYDLVFKLLWRSTTW